MPTWAKMIEYLKKTIPYPAARTNIAHIGEYPPPGRLNRYTRIELLKSYSLLGTRNADAIFSKIESSISSYSFNVGKMNITGSNGRINGVKFQRILQAGFLECGR